MERNPKGKKNGKGSYYFSLQLQVDLDMGEIMKKQTHTAESRVVFWHRNPFQVDCLKSLGGLLGNGL